MKKLYKKRDFWVGMLTMALIVALLVPAGAAMAGKAIQVYTGVTIVMDGVEMQPTDANGDPVDAFIYNGSTYVPIRFILEHLGIPAKWDGSTATAFLGKIPGESLTLQTVCPPYQKDDYTERTTVNMAGNTYTDGFSLGSITRESTGFALYNLNGQYDTLSFDVGHIDGTNMHDSYLSIYLDGELAQTIDLTPEMLPTHYDIDLNGALQMKIEMGWYGVCYAIVNATLE